MVDYYIWPWIERAGMITAHIGVDVINKEDNPKLLSWQQEMMEDPAVKATLISTENHMKFAKTYMQGEPDYDFMFN